MRNWTHPKLGKFEYDGTAWVRSVRAPGFDRFGYDTGYSNAGKPTGDYELAFEGDHAKDMPSDAAVVLASEVLARQDELVPKVINALWDDFNGRGPDSGMWWHGDLGQVAELMPAARTKDEKDFLRIMRLFQIHVRKRVHGYEEPIVELCFWAAFEEEHSVGILTDGKKILGIGYHTDVLPFET